MKKIFLAITSLLLAFPANALPGQTYKEIDQWVKKHQFLSPWLEGDKDKNSPYDFRALAFRQLQENWFLDIVFNISNTGDFDLRKTEYDQLYLIKKKYDDSKQLSEYSFDKRPWTDIECKNIWHRDNETAYNLLKLIYSQSLSDDFKNAKLVFKGTEPAITSMGWGDALIYGYTARDNLTEAKQWGMNNETTWETYAGKKYYYDVNISSPEEPDYPHCISMYIRTINDGKERVNIRLHNKVIYQQWQQWKSQRDSRTTPADIEIR